MQIIPLDPIEETLADEDEAPFNASALSELDVELSPQRHNLQAWTNALGNGDAALGLTKIVLPTITSGQPGLLRDLPRMARGSIR
jgi:hypothetical protein